MHVGVALGGVCGPQVALHALGKLSALQLIYVLALVPLSAVVLFRWLVRGAHPGEMVVVALLAAAVGAGVFVV